jgi:hypothetical protein
MNTNSKNKDCPTEIYIKKEDSIHDKHHVNCPWCLHVCSIFLAATPNFKSPKLYTLLHCQIVVIRSTIKVQQRRGYKFANSDTPLFRESLSSVSNLQNPVEMQRIYNSHRLKGTEI